MVSSVTGPFATNPGSTGYGAAKAGMEGLMRGLALELGPHGDHRERGRSRMDRHGLADARGVGGRPRHPDRTVGHA